MATIKDKNQCDIGYCENISGDGKHLYRNHLKQYITTTTSDIKQFIAQQNKVYKKAVDVFEESSKVTLTCWKCDRSLKDIKYLNEGYITPLIKKAQVNNARFKK